MAKKFYTDGRITIKRDIENGDVIPEGFILGRTFNVNTWNKGKTAKDDPRIKSAIESMVKTRRANDSYHSYNKGLTKETCESLRVVSEKLSMAKKGQPAHNKGVPASEQQKQRQSIAMRGKTPYNKGLTKENYESLNSASKKLKGHKCFVTDWEKAKQKEYETKKKNGTFNTSKKETELYNQLCEEYGSCNVLTQYKEERYPFKCDFYIKSEDLFIEYNGTIEHNGKPFDKDSVDDQNELQKLIELATAKGSKSRYWNVIKWWTEIDPLKLQTMRTNKLNFKVIYPNLTIVK